MTLDMSPDFHPGEMQRLTKDPKYTYKGGYQSQKDYPYAVTLDWDCRPDIERWNNICAWTVEYFGLPGGRYRTEVTTKKMTWFFSDQEDQLIMTLAWGNDDGIDV